MTAGINNHRFSCDYVYFIDLIEFPLPPRMEGQRGQIERRKTLFIYLFIYLPSIAQHSPLCFSQSCPDSSHLSAFSTRGLGNILCRRVVILVLPCFSAALSEILTHLVFWSHNTTANLLLNVRNQGKPQKRKEQLRDKCLQENVKVSVQNTKVFVLFLSPLCHIRSSLCYEMIFLFWSYEDRV